MITYINFKKRKIHTRHAFRALYGMLKGIVFLCFAETRAFEEKAWIKSEDKDSSEMSNNLSYVSS